MLSDAMAVFVLIWALLGLVGFLMSLNCFRYNQGLSSTDNWVGLLSSVILGPFYWIFYYYKPGYCGRQ